MIYKIPQINTLSYDKKTGIYEKPATIRCIRLDYKLFPKNE